LVQKTLLNFIDFVITKINVNLKNTKKIKFLDGFVGSCIVGKYFNEKYNYIVYSNDLEYYSYIIAYALLKVQYSEKLKLKLDELNELIKPMDDKYNLITEHYSEKGKEKRHFLSIDNSEKADAIIENIKKDLCEKKITDEEYIFLLASLLSSFDKVANTASVYGAYLKKYKTSSLKKLNVKPIHVNYNIVNNHKNKNFNVDINSEIITNNDYDIVYLDPPYNNRQYSSNYHPLNFISKYDNEIHPYGKTGLLKNSNKSNYSISKNVENIFKTLIEQLKLKSKYILLSYNNEGLMSSDIIKTILETKGKTTLYKYEYKKFKSQKEQDDKCVYEYLCDTYSKGIYEEYIINSNML
jgi:adenine-specific DNA-methyltransferase